MTATLFILRAIRVALVHLSVKAIFPAQSWKLRMPLESILAQLLRLTKIVKEFAMSQTWDATHCKFHGFPKGMIS